MRSRRVWIAAAALAACADGSSSPTASLEARLAARPSAGTSYAATDLGTLGGSASIAQGINRFGVVVGWSLRQSDPYMHAVVWRTPGQLGPEALPELAGTIESQAFDINGNGDIVGMSGGLADGPHATLWPASGGVVDLGVASGLGYTGIFINAPGEVVWATGGGPVLNTPTRVVRWKQGTLTDLGEPIPGSTNLGVPAGISDKGLIAVSGGRYWERGQWRDLAKPSNATGVISPTRVTASGQALGQTGGGIHNDLGLWWQSPTRLTVLVPNFVPWDIGSNSTFFGHAKKTLPTGQERDVAATYTAKNGVTFLPLPAGNDDFGRAIRGNASGTVVGFTSRASSTVSGRYDNRATMWMPTTSR